MIIIPEYIVTYAFWCTVLCVCHKLQLMVLIIQVACLESLTAES